MGSGSKPPEVGDTCIIAADYHKFRIVQSRIILPKKCPATTGECRPDNYVIWNDLTPYETSQTAIDLL